MCILRQFIIQIARATLAQIGSHPFWEALAMEQPPTLDQKKTKIGAAKVFWNDCNPFLYFQVQ
jgi:hypothetical protein